ncbi:hypothetical protein OSB04_010456 [Centaurea solstitialis]|uniref:PB1 domain-containing protein n=1 Tax=Centaurea solstitialis TaxID=347529 RepID=A0AA38WCU8_9ASTR|nr:hypothetical protein OSB04_010456 [Centaurea solstitialis]
MAADSPAIVVSKLVAMPPAPIQEKIKALFNYMYLEEGVLQFWAPVLTTLGRRWLLTTSDQPFAIQKESDGGKKYRSCSVRYQYNLDINSDVYDIDWLCSYKCKYNVEDMNKTSHIAVEEDPTITYGGPSRAFVHRMPVFLPDLRVHQTSPLDSCALQCGMRCSVFLPVLDPSGTTPWCLGVVECSTPLCRLLDVMVNLFREEIQKQGLKTFDVRPPYESVCGLADAQDEIKKALEIIWPEFCLDLVQVWIADSQTGQMFGIKLMDYPTDYDSDDDEYLHECLGNYRSICRGIPLKMWEGLVGKTLKNHKPRFMKKVSKLSDNQPLMMVRPNYFEFEGDPFECSCFVICLRSTETGDFNYVFEFLWEEDPNYVELLETLLLSLKKCLPNFKYASGGELGDALHIIDVDKSTKSKTNYFSIFKGMKSSSKPLEAKCKTTPIALSQESMIDPARNLYVPLATLKRKRMDQIDTNEENKGAFPDENTLTVKAEYADDLIKFTLPISSATFSAIEKEISKGFELNPANYKLKYLDKDGDWILLKSDEDLKVCIKGRRNPTSVVRLRLLPRQPEVEDKSLVFKHVLSLRIPQENLGNPHITVWRCLTSKSNGSIVNDTRIEEYEATLEHLQLCQLFKHVLSSNQLWMKTTLQLPLFFVHISVSGLQHARDAIMKALEIIWQKFRVDLVQVWIAYDDEEHVAFSVSLEDSPTKRMLGLKLAQYIGDEELYKDGYVYECFCDHSSICQDIPLKIGEGLVGRTLANRKPRFMRRLSKLNDNNEPLVLISTMFLSSCGKKLGGEPKIEIIDHKDKSGEIGQSNQIRY